jgi:hypothetical protein
MRKVAFLIAASPVPAFFSQIAVFRVALGHLNWRRWQPSVHVFMAGKADGVALSDWYPYLDDLAMVHVPGAGATPDPFFFTQRDAVFRLAPTDADVLATMGADTLPVADFEDVLDYVVETESVAGVIAHANPLLRSRGAWQNVAEGLISAPLDFRYAYSLTAADVPTEERLAPFYVNNGVVFFPRSGFRELSQCHLRLRPRLMDRLPDPFFAGQVALALALAETGTRTCALLMRYNFPNDALAETRYPEELDNVSIFHYLRTDKFDRHPIFVNAVQYAEFLKIPLEGANHAFQQQIKTIIGSEYPFGK